MSVLMIRHPAADERGGDVIDAIGTAFTTGETQLPGGIRSIERAQSGIEAARHLPATVAKWAVGKAPTPRTLDVLAAYCVLG